jgi:hypothetical protein
LYKLSLLFTIIGSIALGYKFLSKSESISPSSSFNESRYKTNTEKEYFPLSANCENPQIGFLEFKNDVYAHEDFVKFYKLNEKPDKLVKDQLKFIDGYLDHLDNKNFKFVPHHQKDFSIVSTQVVKYPTDLVIDKIPVDHSLYPDSIFERPINNGQKALKISYKARVKVTKCSNKRGSENFDIILPKDPYLAFWYVPLKARVLLVQSRKHKSITNPCSNKLMAELKYPNMYWNVWKPLAKEKRFDCSKLLKLRDHLQLAKSKFKPLVPVKKLVSYEYLKEKKKLKISLISGFVEGGSPLKINQNAKQLVDYVNKLKEIRKKDFVIQDIGVRASYTVVGLMNKISSNSSWKVNSFKDYSVITGSGTLLNSSKDYIMDIYIGATVDYQDGTKHWAFLADALEQSDFIFYSGHAGMGTTFTLKNVFQNSKLKSLAKSPNSQFIAVFSCSSISYFGEDFINERSNYSKQTDFLLTGFDGHAYQLTPAVMQFIDLKLSGRKVAFKEVLESHLEHDFDIHLTRNK